MSIFDRSVQILRTEGVLTLLQLGTTKLYGQTREFLPRKTAKYSDVKVRAGRMLDDYIPGFCLNRPNYESGLTSSITNNVQRGEHVVIVGGGWGVTAVIAARCVGPNGRVTVYEGSEKQAADVRETLDLNNVADRVTVEHAIVGTEVSLFGSAGDAAFIPSDELPECDVLSLDCEGAELDILDGYKGNPRMVFVETHGVLGASKADVEILLTDLGYAVEDVSVAEENSREYCEDNGIYVLTALRVDR